MDTVIEQAITTPLIWCITNYFTLHFIWL